MEDKFLHRLAERKYALWDYLHVKQPAAYTTEQCAKRSEMYTRYMEVIYIIDLLPIDQTRKVNELFNQLKDAFK